MKADIAKEVRLIRLLCFLIPFSAMNIAMFNVALPDIASQFQISSSTVSWVVTIFAVIYALGTLIYGKLTDLFAIKTLVTFGILLFSIGSILGFFAQNYSVLLIARIVQAVGASCIPALAMLIPVRYVAVERRGKALGIVAATLAFSAGIGPIVGGFISGVFHWKYMFLLPLGTLFTVPFFQKWVPKQAEKKEQRVDVLGAIFLGTTITCLMLTITKFNLWLLIGSFCFLIFFIMKQKKVEHPIFPRILLRNSQFRHGLLIGSLSSSTNFGILILTPLLLHQVYGLSANEIGLIMFPGAMSAALLGKYGGKLVDQKGIRPVAGLAIMLLILCLALFSVFAGYTTWIIIFNLILGNVGYSFLQASLGKWVSTTLPSEHVGVGMGVYSLNNFLSVALCGSLVTKLLEIFHTIPMNPFSLPGNSAPYSSVYFILLLIALINMIFLLNFLKKDNNSYLS